LGSNLLDQTIALLVIKVFHVEVARMNANAVPQAGLKAGFLLVPLAAAAVLLAGLGGTAAAAPPVGKDGQIHACYRVKGKPKGSLRVVPSAKKRCRRGERKVTWSVAGSAGQVGANGQSAGNGQSGQSGVDGSSGADGAPGTGEAALITKVASLSLRVEELENVLDGLDNTQLLNTVDAVKGLDNGVLTDAVEAVEGLTHSELNEAVKSLPAVESLCEQTPELAEQANLLGEVIGDLGLGGVLGGFLEIPTLPNELKLNEFGC
jgi:hypothetical protein